MPLVLVREREMDGESETAGEGVVEILAQIGREDRQSLEFLHLLQQIGDFEIGVAVVRIAHLGPLAEQRVRLVEEQDTIGVLRGREQPVEVLFCLADVFADNCCEVDLVEKETELMRNDFGRQRLAGAGGAGK